MRSTAKLRLALLLLLACLTCGLLAAQQPATTPSSTEPAHSSSTSAPPQSPAAQQQPSEHGEAAAGEESKSENKGGGEEEEEAKFKYSPSVSWFARHFGLSTQQMYWISLFFNFVLLALFFWVLLKAKLPQAFRDRKAGIQKSIQEAQAASADAARRLAEIEVRMGKLDSDVAEIRASAEKEAAAEEERIRRAAEEDKSKIVQAAEAEITAIARNARRELKGYAASLAVDLAARRIRIDESTDQALVREFVDQFGKDGK